MEQRIVFKNLDGSCGIITPAENSGLSIEEIAEKDVPEGLEYRIIDIDKLPTDRTFRNAWTDDNPTETIDVHMNKARIIHMARIRQARAQKFIDMGFPNKLHPELETGIISKETRDKLQTLRDIPQNLDLSKASTPEELKAIWPEELK